MDSSSEKSCLEEISVLVFDSLEKVTIKTISNNWQVSNIIAKDVLEKWFSQNQKKLKDIVKEFIVQGINSNGIFSLSVVNEETKQKIEGKWKDFRSWPYSVETKSNSKSLNLPPKFEPIQIKSIKIDTGTRSLEVKSELVANSNVDTTKIKTPFGMVKPVDKKVVEIKKEKHVQNDSDSVETLQNEKTKSTDSVKEESLADKSTKNVCKKGGASAKVAQGKASISAFFNKSSSSTRIAKSEEPTTSKIKEEPEFEIKREEISRKRSPTPEKKNASEKSIKQPNKKLKLKDQPNKKRTRIQVIDDSSEEEQDEEPAEEPESKFIKFDRELTPDETTKPDSPEKIESTKIKSETTTQAAKNKAKRWVTKRFETEDGFIRTEKVLEEYSASEDENDENRKKNSPLQEKKSSPMKESPKKKVNKNKSKDVGKAKQGSITSFFTKK